MFNTKKEKYAFVRGIVKGQNGGKPFGKKPKKKKSNK